MWNNSRRKKITEAQSHEKIKMTQNKRMAAAVCLFMYCVSIKNKIT